MSRSASPIHVEVSGHQPGPEVDTFVLIHGYGASAFTWRYWARGLAGRGHVVALDLKGFGRAAKPDDGSYGPEAQAELVQLLIEERDLRRITLVGHSLGGGVALLTALRIADAGPPRVARMVIVAGAAYDQRLPPFVWLADHPRLSVFLFRVFGARRIVRSVLRQIVHDPAGVDEEQVRGYADPLAADDALRALIATARQIRPDDLDAIAARYCELEIPTLLLWGRGDRVVPLSIGERLAREMRDARLHVFERCGHLPPEELHVESFAVLERFLDEHRGSAPPPSGRHP